MNKTTHLGMHSAAMQASFSEEIKLYHKMAKRLLAQAVNLFVSAVRVGMVTWGPNGIDSLLDLKWLNFSDPEVATWYASICLCKSTQYLYVAGFYCFLFVLNHLL